jgi:endonuclease/exonuclease/phosphatase family metal-dependent hydrolase
LLSGLEAEVIALQEVALASVDGTLVDNAGDLGRQLGMAVHYGAVRSFAVTEGDAVTGAGCFGNAILARRPLEAVRTVALPRASMDALVEPTGAEHQAAGVRYADAPDTIREPRCLVLGRLDGLAIGSTHLSHVGSGERLLQAAALDAAFGGASPALLLGDLNAPAGAPELAPLSAWSDAFAEAPGDGARVSTDDGWAIDHVLGRGVSVSGCRVVREAGDLSDHYPVVAEANPIG